MTEDIDSQEGHWFSWEFLAQVHSISGATLG